MKNFAVYMILAYFVLMVQSLFFKGIKPDLVLVLVCFYAVSNVMARCLFYGAFTGLLLDLVGGFMIGPNIISKSIASYLTKAIRDSLLEWNGVVNVLVIALMSIIDIVIVYSCFEIFSDVSFSNRPWNAALWHFLYTVVAGLVFYNFFHPDRDTILNSTE